jgi:cytochrome c
MKRRVTFIGIALLAGAPGTTVAIARSSPPASPKAREVEALVNKAAVLIDAKGKTAFSEFRVKGSEWFHGDIYLFAYDLKGNVLLNPAFPAREGSNVSGQRRLCEAQCASSSDAAARVL